MSLKGKKALIGITGSIAAYKAAILIRLLIKEGAEVKVVMTPLAKEFVAPLTFATLSKNPILVDFFNPENGEWNSHVDLGLWADFYLIAPATANTIAKMANGIADNLLLTTYISVRCPVFIAPAMDLDMYQHPATLKNIEILKSQNVEFIEPASGELASGLVGEGRLEEPEVILNRVKSYFDNLAHLKGKKFLVTAGPTYEKIDPVRFIGNFSSGKMGYAIAEELANQGGDVFLVSGPVNLKLKNKKIKKISVVSAYEMYTEALKYFPDVDCAIFAAAVADYTPILEFDKKLKKERSNLTIELKPTQDIAAELGKLKRIDQLTLGFALETDNEIENAVKKLISKNFDFIILNSLSDKGAGFQHDTNKITIIGINHNITSYALKPKPEVARDIVNKIAETILKKK